MTTFTIHLRLYGPYFAVLRPLYIFEITVYVCVFCGRCKWQNWFVFQSVVEHSHLSSEMFVLYLHQNYVSFYEDLDDIVRAYLLMTYWHDM